MLIAGWLWLCAERARRVRILEREILDVLAEHVELGLRLRLLGLRGRSAAPLVVDVMTSPPPRSGPRCILTVAAWLTQGQGPDKDHGAAFARSRLAGHLAASFRGVRVLDRGLRTPGATRCGLSSTTGGVGGSAPALAAAPGRCAAPAHRRSGGRNRSAPTRSVINPGNTRRIPPAWRQSRGFPGAPPAALLLQGGRETRRDCRARSGARATRRRRGGEEEQRSSTTSQSAWP